MLLFSILVFGWVWFKKKLVIVWVGFLPFFFYLIYLRRCYCFAFGIWVGMAFNIFGILVGGFFVIFGIWVGGYFNIFGIWVGWYFNIFGIWVGGYLESKWHTPVGICGSDPPGSVYSLIITHTYVPYSTPISIV
jgi:hypothetical protein